MTDAVFLPAIEGDALFRYRTEVTGENGGTPTDPSYSPQDGTVPFYRLRANKTDRFQAAGLSL